MELFECKRILIIGCPGTGKTTLSLKLKKILSLEVFHLDRYFWEPAWVLPDKAEFIETVSMLSEKDSWIIEGNYSGTLGMRAMRADAIFFFDYHPLLCLYRISKRIFESKLGIKTRVDLAEGCSEKWFDPSFVKFTYSFRKKIVPLNYSILEEIDFDKKRLIVFKNPGQVKNFLKNCTR